MTPPVTIPEEVLAKARFGFSITFDNESQSRAVTPSASAKNRSGDRPPAAPVRLYSPWRVYREHRA